MPHKPAGLCLQAPWTGSSLACRGASIGHPPALVPVAGLRDWTARAGWCCTWWPWHRDPQGGGNLCPANLILRTPATPLTSPLQPGGGGAGGGRCAYPVIWSDFPLTLTARNTGSRWCRYCFCALAKASLSAKPVTFTGELGLCCLKDRDLGFHTVLLAGQRWH